MDPQTATQPEPKAARRWAAVKPITQGELIDAARAAIAAQPTADSGTGEAEAYATRLRFAFFIGYIGGCRPNLRRELRKMMEFGNGESTGAAS